MFPLPRTVSPTPGYAPFAFMPAVLNLLTVPSSTSANFLSLMRAFQNIPACQ
jgi:hypothetical protein